MKPLMDGEEFQVDLTLKIYQRSFSLKTTGCEGAEWMIFLRTGSAATSYEQSNESWEQRV
jgi:hypothetical protein